MYQSTQEFKHKYCKHLGEALNFRCTNQFICAFYSKTYTSKISKNWRLQRELCKDCEYPQVISLGSVQVEDFQCGYEKHVEQRQPTRCPQAAGRPKGPRESPAEHVRKIALVTIDLHFKIVFICVAVIFKSITLALM